MTPVSTGRISRRGAIRIVAALAGIPLLATAVRHLAPEGRFFRWQGEVQGVLAEIALWDHDAPRAQAMLRTIEGEIRRYDAIFNLQNENSEISRLNRDGAIAGASGELRKLVEISQHLGDVSEGSFDITLQPVWRVYEDHFWTRASVVADPAARAMEVARAKVDYRNVDVGADRIRFAKAGMGMSLNGIAQGFITDMIADLVGNAGYESAMIDLGEIRAIGRHPEGRPWRMGIRNALHEEQVDRQIELSGMAMAVSGGYGTPFEPTGRYHHIFEPVSGDSARSLLDVAVVTPRATIADGLATAIYVTGEARAANLLKAFSGSRAIVTRTDGTRATIGPEGPFAA